MDTDKLRRHHLNKAPYPYDEFIREGSFTTDEIAAIKKYGYWFEAIWNGKIPLNTDKLKSFGRAKDLKTSGRTKWEKLWIRYERERCPF